LKTVAKNFKELFSRTIAHPGKGYLGWIYDDDLGMDDDFEEDLREDLFSFLKFNFNVYILIKFLFEGSQCESLVECFPQRHF